MRQPLALIIEDSSNQADVFALVLQQFGFETEIKSDGQAALEWLETAIPDLITIDLHLPKVSGTSIVKHVRSEERFRQVKVIVITSDEIKAREIGSQADTTLIKPFSIVKLRDAIKQLCSLELAQTEAATFAQPQQSLLKRKTLMNESR